jgi:hypothetical protein
MPNARHQARRATGAQWTLYAVACTPSLGGSRFVLDNFRCVAPAEGDGLPAAFASVEPRRTFHELSVHAEVRQDE